MNKIYNDDLINVSSVVPKIENFKNKTIFISGSTGLIGTFIIDLFMHLNEVEGYNTTIISNGRNEERIKERFSNYLDSNNFKIYAKDINDGIDYEGDVDYIINCASNTHPKLYSTDPIGTIMTNIKGTDNILKFASEKNAKKTLFLSSVEIYGVNVNNIERFKESDMGYIDCNTLRAGYNEAKRAGEALCQAYIEQKGIDISIIRLPRLYGPTIKEDDTKALSQFINKAINKENIVLKSEGNQYFSYLYVADAVSGILTTLIHGKKGEVYNLANVKSDIKLKDLANIIANYCGTEVIFDLPNEIEEKGYSKATVARLDATKAEEELNWHPIYSIEDGVKKTIEILSNKKNKHNALKMKTN